MKRENSRIFYILTKDSESQIQYFTQTASLDSEQIQIWLVACGDKHRRSFFQVLFVDIRSELEATLVCVYSLPLKIQSIIVIVKS